MLSETVKISMPFLTYNFLPRLVRGFAFVSTKAVLVRKSRWTFETHILKAPSGSELAPKATEEERVAIKLV